MSGIGFGPIYIPNLNDLAKRIGHITDMWFEPCGSPFAYISYIGPLINRAFWTALPLDYKHAYKFATGKSWVKTLRGVVAGLAEEAPVVAGIGDAFLDFAALADTAAWWWWVANGIVAGIQSWGSLAQLAKPCEPGSFVGYAICPAWALTNPNIGNWGPLLWDPILNPMSFFGIRGGFIPKEYHLTNLGFNCGSIHLGGSPGWVGHRLLVTPGFTTGPSMMDRFELMPDPEPIDSQWQGAIIDRNNPLNRRIIRMNGDPADGPDPPFPPSDCGILPPGPTPPVWPNCFAKTAPPQPSDGVAKSAVWSRIPDFKQWRAHTQFTGINFTPLVTHANEIDIVLDGECRWAFQTHH